MVHDEDSGTPSDVFRQIVKLLVQYETERFERKLRNFANKKGISTSSPHWKSLAIEIAAREHPDLDTKKRRRGAPSKVKLTGLSEKDRNLLDDIQFIKTFAREKRSGAVSETVAIRVYVGWRQNTWRGEAMFKSNVATTQKRLRKALKLAGNPNPPGRPKKPTK